MNSTITNHEPQQPSIQPNNSELRRDSLALQASAQKLMSRGLSIFPCKPRGKEPLGQYAPHGFKSARNDESALRAWQAGIAANIGVACEASAITVVDCDTGFVSQEDAMSWAHELGFDTLTVRTGRASSCGMHFYFSGTIKSCSFELNGVSGQIKSAGGYVIGAGSVHESGKLYEVVHDVPMAVLPPCFASLGINTKTNAPAGNDEDLVPVGQRRKRLLRLAGILVTQRLSEKGIYDALIDFLENACEDGSNMAVTDDADIRRIAHDASTKWEPNDPLETTVLYVSKDSIPSPSTHMSDELYGFYTRALEQSNRGILYFNGRTFAKKFAHMGHTTAYRRARELEMSGWFELIRKGGNDAEGRPLCTIYRIRNLSQWESWRSQRPEATAMCQTLQTRTEGCVAWLKERLAGGPVFSDTLEKERLSLEYSRKVYRDARAHVNVKWSQRGGRRVSWIGSNGLIIGMNGRMHE